MNLAVFYFLLTVGYIIGSLSSAILVSKFMHLPDPRLSGSHNPGATNVLRLSGKFPALLVMIGDVAKGVFPVWLARQMGLEGIELALIAFMAILGHIFPIFFGFKGGKGVATTLGAITMLCWPVGVGMCVVWLVVALLTRYSSLASLVALLSMLLFNDWFGVTHYTLPFIFIIMIVYLRHIDNIKRLLKRQESQIGKKA